MRKLCINFTEVYFISCGIVPLFLSVESFEKITFPYLEDIKREKGYPSERHSVLIVDTFKGQDNDTFSD